MILLSVTQRTQIVEIKEKGTVKNLKKREKKGRKMGKQQELETEGSNEDT